VKIFIERNEAPINKNRSKLSKFVLFLGLIIVGSIILSGAVSAATVKITPSANTINTHSGDNLTHTTGTYIKHNIQVYKNSITTGPKVSSTTPTNLKTGVSRTATIVIKCNKNIKSSTYFSNIKVKNLATNKYLTITKTITGNTLYLKSTTKSANTWYQVTIPKAAIKDFTNKNLYTAYVFKFKTAPTTTTTLKLFNTVSTKIHGRPYNWKAYKTTDNYVKVILSNPTFSSITTYIKTGTTLKEMETINSSGTKYIIPTHITKTSLTAVQYYYKYFKANLNEAG